MGKEVRMVEAWARSGNSQGGSRNVTKLPVLNETLRIAVGDSGASCGRAWCETRGGYPNQVERNGGRKRRRVIRSQRSESAYSVDVKGQ